MQRFTAKVVDAMKGAGLYASQGGPIILSQVLPPCPCPPAAARVAADTMCSRSC